MKPASISSISTAWWCYIFSLSYIRSMQNVWSFLENVKLINYQGKF